MTFRLVVAAAAALALSGCPDTLQQQCPGGVPAGNFLMALTLQDTTDACRQILLPDGGSTDASVASVVAPANSTLYSGLADGGPSICLAVTGAQAGRSSPLDADAGFTFISTVQNVTQSICLCSIDITETVKGNLVVPGDAGFTVDADGGINPKPSGYNGTLVDSIVATPGTSGCLCNLPCALHYTLTGTPN
jgi:hypothetical protein